MNISKLVALLSRTNTSLIAKDSNGRFLLEKLFDKEVLTTKLPVFSHDMIKEVETLIQTIEDSPDNFHSSRDEIRKMIDPFFPVNPALIEVGILNTYPAKRMLFNFSHESDFVFFGLNFDRNKIIEKDNAGKYKFITLIKTYERLNQNLLNSESPDVQSKIISEANSIIESKNLNDMFELIDRYNISGIQLLDSIAHFYGNIYKSQITTESSGLNLKLLLISPLKYLLDHDFKDSKGNYILSHILALNAIDLSNLPD